MKPLLRFVSLLAVIVFASAPALRASEADDFAEVRRADQRRIVATIAADTAALEKLLSDHLHYAHSDGRVQTKPEFIATAAAKKIRYLSVVPEGIVFQSIVPGSAVAMSGNARLAVAQADRRLDLAISFLTVWRKEDAAWRLLSYQSCPIATAPAPSPAR